MWRKSFVFLMVCLFVLLSACSSLTPTGDTVITTSRTNEPINKTVIGKTYQSPTVTRTKQPVSTSTPPQKLAPLTPLPTEPNATVQARITNLLKENANCRLPCWWGIIPAQTNWTDAARILDPLTGNRKNKSNEWGYYFPNNKDKTYINQRYVLDGGVVEIIEITFGNAPFLTLSEFLKEYGPPSDVYIRTFRNKYQGITPFFLILFYAQQGILARFESDTAQLTSKTVKVCLQEEPAWGIVLWPPENELSYNEVVETAKTVGMGNSEDNHLPLLSIEVATNSDPISFYDEFKDSNSVSCLETPLEIWPGQFE